MLWELLVETLRYTYLRFKAARLSHLVLVSTMSGLYRPHSSVAVRLDTASLLQSGEWTWGNKIKEIKFFVSSDAIPQGSSSPIIAHHRQSTRHQRQFGGENGTFRLQKQKKRQEEKQLVMLMLSGVIVVVDGSQDGDTHRSSVEKS